MRKIYLGSKKVRGKKRLLQSFLRFAQKFKDFFPEPDYERGYRNYPIPIHQGFADDPKLKRKTKKLIIETILRAHMKLLRNKPKNLEFVKIVSIINVSHLFYSGIAIFFSEDYYNRFFKRNTAEQKWVRLPKERSLFKEWDFSGEIKLKEIGFHEEINDEDYQREGELWMYGDVPEI